MVENKNSEKIDNYSTLYFDQTGGDYERSQKIKKSMKIY